MPYAATARATIYVYGTQTANSVTAGGVALGAIQTVIAPEYPGNLGPNVAAGSVALGLEDHLDDFARGIGGTTWKKIVTNNPETWLKKFRELLFDGETKFTFNLDGVDVWAGVARAARGEGGYTDNELLLIMQNRQFWDRITWITNGEVRPNPFQ